MGKHKEKKKVGRSRSSAKRELTELKRFGRPVEEEIEEMIKLDKEGILNLECGRGGLSYFLPNNYPRRDFRRPSSKSRSKVLLFPTLGEFYKSCTEAVAAREHGGTFYEKTTASMRRNQIERDDLNHLREEEARRKAEENRKRLLAEKKGKLALKKARKRDLNVSLVRNQSSSDED